MRVFELINLMANGIKLLVLEECTAWDNHTQKYFDEEIYIYI